MKSTMIATDPNKVIEFGSQGKKSITPTKTCCLDGCNNTLTEYKGPGSRSLCEEHQRTLREYGGFARLDRKWTFWKKPVCERCGHDPMNNVRLRNMAEPRKSILAMRLLQVDHIIPSKDKRSRNNHPSNLQTLCGDCHSLKTIENGDF